MGFRTVVVLVNDNMHQWAYDSELGRKIADATDRMFGRQQGDPGRIEDGYGTVVECAHADNQSMVVLNHYSAVRVSTDNWRGHETDEALKLKMVKQAASELGFRLVRKSVKKDQDA